MIISNVAHVFVVVYFVDNADMGLIGLGFA